MNYAEKDCYFKDRNKKEKISLFAEVAETYNSETTINNRMYVVDSGSTCHMTNIKTDLTQVKQYTQCIKIAKKNQNMTAEEMGDLEFKECSFKNVSYVPELSRNLLSVNWWRSIIYKGESPGIKEQNCCNGRKKG
jgi:hypothetical protein